MAKRKASSAGPKPASIRGIARATGFSSTTVSLVLNGRAADFSITDETRDLILARAREVNYQPNLHARNLRSGRSDILGLMVPTLRNAFFGEMAEAFEALARADQKLALIHVTRYDRAEEIEAIRYFQSQNADCVFVANPMGLEEIARLGAGHSCRQIFLDAEAGGHTTVSTDNFGAARELTRAILASMAREGRLGRLFFFGGMADHPITLLRLKGFRAALAEAGHGFRSDQVIHTPFDAEASYETIRAHFRTGTPTAGMFVNSTVPMEGLIRYFPQSPDACRAIHYGLFDGSPYLNLLADLKIASVEQDPRGIIETGFRLFHQGDAGHAPEAIRVPYRLILPGAAAGVAGG